MINTDQRTLIELLKAKLFNGEPYFHPGTNWNDVFEIAKQQGVVALAETFVPEQHKNAWEKEMLQSKKQYILLLYAQNKIIQTFQEHSIPMVILKGSSAAMYYPVPSCRAMGDIDVLVSMKRYADAKKLLRDIGYQFTKEDYRNSTFIQNNIIVELHYRFSAVEKDIEPLISDGLCNAVKYTIEEYSFPGLPWCVNGIVLLEHIRQHLVRSGLGLRQIIDWMMFVHSGLDDTAWVTEFKRLTQDTRLEKLAVTMTFMCIKWFGLPDEISWCNNADEELADLLLARLFSDGNFGRNKPITEDAIRQLRKKGAFAYIQRAGLNNWKAAQIHSALRPFAWLYQLGRYGVKGADAMLHSKDAMKGFLTGSGKENMLKRLEIE